MKITRATTQASPSFNSTDASCTLYAAMPNRARWKQVDGRPRHSLAVKIMDDDDEQPAPANIPPGAGSQGGATHPCATHTHTTHDERGREKEPILLFHTHTPASHHINNLSHISERSSTIAPSPSPRAQLLEGRLSRLGVFTAAANRANG